MAEKLFCEPTIATESGIEFYLLEPTAEMIHWPDVATGLAKCVRYSGHSYDFYSVARHSIIMSYAVPAAYALEAMLHDAAEAYLGDCSTPLKQLLPRFKQIEHGVLRAIYDAAHLPQFGDDPVSPVIHNADTQLFYAEWHALMPPVRWVEYPEPSADFDIDVRYLLDQSGGDWKRDRAEYLSRLYELLADQQGHAVNG